MIKKYDEISEEIIILEDVFEDIEDFSNIQEDDKKKQNNEISEQPKITQYFRNDESIYMDIDE